MSISQNSCVVTVYPLNLCSKVYTFALHKHYLCFSPDWHAVAVNTQTSQPQVASWNVIWHLVADMLGFVKESPVNSLHMEIIYMFSLAMRKLPIFSVVRTEGQS